MSNVDNAEWREFTLRNSEITEPEGAQPLTPGEREDLRVKLRAALSKLPK